jgi:hypothetical protein
LSGNGKGFSYWGNLIVDGLRIRQEITCRCLVEKRHAQSFKKKLEIMYNVDRSRVKTRLAVKAIVSRPFKYMKASGLGI